MSETLTISWDRISFPLYVDGVLVASVTALNQHLIAHRFVREIDIPPPVTLWRRLIRLIAVARK
jgi:hypothetical protein